jgi:hypothetical protein
MPYGVPYTLAGELPATFVGFGQWLFRLRPVLSRQPKYSHLFTVLSRGAK